MSGPIQAAAAADTLDTGCWSYSVNLGEKIFATFVTSPSHKITLDGCIYCYCTYHYHIHKIKYTIRSIVCEASCHPVTQSLVTQSFSFSVIQSPGHLVTWSLGHLVTWSLGHSVTWLLGYLVTRSLGHSVTWSLGHSVNQSLGHLVTRSLGHSVTRHHSTLRLTH